MPKPAGRALLIRFAALALSLLLSLLLLEAMAQILAIYVLEQGRMFTADERLGWRPRANLDRRRAGPEGAKWHVRTDAQGLRSDREAWDDAGRRARRRVVVLGDSYAFGEPVEREQRFDAVFEAAGIASLNLGVPGFGTGQAALRFDEVREDLRPGDVVLLLTYRNDFFDLLRARHAGRQKPLFELDASDPRGFRVRFPRLGLADQLRNVSFFFARTAALLEAPADEIGDDDLARAARLYEVIVRDLAQRVRERGARTRVVFHGLNDETRPPARLAMSVCEPREGDRLEAAPPALECLDLEHHLSAARDPDLFLSDGHWSAAGHERVGRVLLGVLERLPGL